MNENPAEVYDDLKARLKRLGMELKRFASLLGLSETTMPKWRSIGCPPYALNFLRILEIYTVSASWQISRAKPAPTQEDATGAMRSPLVAVVDDAIAKGWTRAQIAATLRQLAGETDGTGPT